LTAEAGQGRAPFVAIAGNIGSGKSSLAALIAARCGHVLVPEPVEANPYLADFYADMPRWGFHSQIFFLAHRIEQHVGVMRSGVKTVQDRTIYEDAEVFARHLHRQGVLTDRDFATYNALYDTAKLTLEPPQAVIYLRASVPTLLERIKKRGRAMERAIDARYLAGLNELYDLWIDNFRAAPVLKIDADFRDFVAREKDLEAILALVPS
jgi:deoxyadenosine/deoxycytidine kinase